MNKKTFKDKRKIKLLRNDIDYFEGKVDDLEEVDFVQYPNPENSDDEIVDIVEDEILEEEEELEVEEKKDKKLLKKINKEKFYVDPKEFDEEIMKFYDNDLVSDKLAEMISKISNKLSYASNFINYSYREEMVGDGIIRMMKALISKKYNRSKGTNPFSYFTRIAFNAFRNRIKKEKHIHETHEKYQNEFMLMAENFNSYSKNKNSRISNMENIKY
jgi:hypothetical protein